MKRQVGGTANKIMLWPLGGVAYVDPPPRPAATLWSIAAGPLVNVVLLGASATLAFWGRHVAWRLTFPHAYKLLWAILAMNLGLLVFNLLPIYRVQRDGVDVLAVAIKTALHDATTKLDFAIGIVEIIESATRGSRRVFFAFSEFSPVHIIRRRSHSRFLIRSTISRVMMSNE